MLQKAFSNFIGKAFIFTFLLITVYPIVWLILSSFKDPGEFSNPMYSLPDGVYIQNYIDAWTIGNMGTYFKNSILVTFPSLFFILIFGAAAAFAIEKMKWKLNNAVMLLFLAGIMIPMQIVLLPLFSIYHSTGLLNNLLGLIIVYIAFGLPLTIFLFSGYYKTLPNELIEAAIIDGASIYQIFFKISIPMILNAFVSVALVQFFFVWNDLIFAMTFISDSELRTIQTGLINFTGQYGQRQWGPTFASISLAIIPTLVLYLVLNKLVMKGMTSGAVKG
ncbi:carbohydrate ABC transporter permease [Aquibacillus albus]|uniref:Raffinose/stachyose/melibiose transport system permease protein n=1 Tax=Aquibacillus albus TaxID=1168171 RepID=A0ABS2N4F6_9BACI|nr:carbohydrate ABC transporter permease [Aquibacillus albus]MBM7572986.1 raffinose/stachyose/melibiose transport system permease protein [Aquibacillus albus]